MNNRPGWDDEYVEILRGRLGWRRREDHVAAAFATLLRYAPSLLATHTRRRRFRCDGQLLLDLGD